MPKMTVTYLSIINEFRSSSCFLFVGFLSSTYITEGRTIILGSNCFWSRSELEFLRKPVATSDFQWAHDPCPLLVCPILNFVLEFADHLCNQYRSDSVCRLISVLIAYVTKI